MAQSVARRLGKAEVGGSSPLDSFEPFPGIARECGVSGVFLISADSRCRSSNLHRFQQKFHCRFSYRFTGLKKKCKESVELVETGRFGADMKVSLLNDGPFTIVLDSEKL